MQAFPQFAGYSVTLMQRLIPVQATGLPVCPPARPPACPPEQEPRSQREQGPRESDPDPLSIHDLSLLVLDDPPGLIQRDNGIEG